MTNSEFIVAVDNYIKLNERNIVADIKKLIDIKSVRDTAVTGAPFGIGVKNAVDAALSIASNLGLETSMKEDVMGVAELNGTGDKTIGIIAHLDVVPEGNGWASDPFCMIEKDGYLIGRGIADDKGPAVLALYAAAFFRTLGTVQQHNIRVLLGTDEESGMGDVPLYLEKNKAPDFTFTPDGSFPVCNGEKGLFSATLKSNKLTGVVKDLTGGVAFNVVPDLATAVLAMPLEGMPVAPKNITLSSHDDGVLITATGKSGHASMPEGTVNAIGEIVNYILSNNLATGDEKRYLELLQDLFNTPNGSGLGIDTSDGIFTPLTIIGGLISTKDGVVSQSIDCRFPTSTNADKLEAHLTLKATSAGASLDDLHRDAPFYIEADSEPILTLLNAYNRVTGKNESPFVMGGGTYARHLPNAVSFGIEEEGEIFPDFVGAMHSANEGFKLEKLLTALKIYIISLNDLMSVEL